MRTQTPPRIRTLMALAAELRAGGHTWEAIALQLQRTVRTVRAWATHYPTDWDRLYRAAETHQLAEAGLEAYLQLRKFLRSDDPRLVERISKYLYDQRRKIVAEQAKLDVEPDDPAAGRDEDWDLFIAYLESLPHDERQALEAEMVARWIAQAAGGAPASGGDPGPAVAE